MLASSSDEPGSICAPAFGDRSSRGAAQSSGRRGIATPTSQPPRLWALAAPACPGIGCRCELSAKAVIVTVRLRRRRRFCACRGQIGRDLEIHDRRLKRWRYLDLGAAAA
jgi:hypothetical protein